MIRVMIVEDDPATGLLLRKLVKRVWPQAVITLDIDPVAALERWQQFGADLVLLDWELPGLSGLDILKAIRRSEAKTICAMITSHSDRGEILAARSHRIDAYIVKPFDAKRSWNVCNKLWRLNQRMITKTNTRFRYLKISWKIVLNAAC